MKINQITIKNFRCFHGEQKLSFNTDGKITLIHGPSGSGKTSLLSFISWVLFGEFQKVNGDKPIYNKSIAEKALKQKSGFNVEGIIDMFDNKNEYKVIRVEKYEFIGENFRLMSTKLELLYRNITSNSGSENISFQPYEKDVNEKINELLPESLSKYFFFKGESGINLVDKTNSLEKAIYSIFDLNKYEEAIIHIGTKAKEHSLLGKINKEIAKNNVTSKYGNMQEVQSKLFSYSHVLPLEEKKLEKKETELNANKKRIKECFSMINSSVDSAKIKETTERNNSLIDQLQKNNSKFIKDFSYKLTNILPYLLLTNKAVKVRNYLAEIAAESKKNSNNKIFINLTRGILEEIKAHNICICGRDLDDISKSVIDNTLDLLPPNSFSMLFRQFVEKNKNKLISAANSFDNLRSILQDISENDVKIDELLRENANNLKLLEGSDVEKESKLASEISRLEKSNSTLISEISTLKIKVDSINKGIVAFTTDYNKMYKASQISIQYNDKIEILNESLTLIKNTFEKKKKDVRLTLEKCIQNTFDLLSTRKDDHNGLFLQDDFTLREEYKTGGQEIIDVYSYIIGMVKALKQTDDSGENEFPIIVDAPFSKTDEIQLANVIDVMPEIVSQVAFFTFDLLRIKECANLNKIGKVWILESDEYQENTIIKEGVL